MNGAYFVKAAKLDSIAVPYKSTPPAMIDLIGGQVHFMFVDMASSQASRQEPAACARSASCPTSDRSSCRTCPPSAKRCPGFDTTPWAGFFVPAGTSKAIISRLSSETVKTINKPAISQKLTELGLEPVPSGPDELDKFVQQQLKNWGQKIRDAGIQTRSEQQLEPSARYSALIPVSRITSAHTPVSLLMRAASSFGVLNSGSNPWRAIASCTSGIPITRTTAAWIRLTIAIGVPAVSSSEYQERTSNPG